YAFKTFKMKVNEHEFWVVESTELKGCAVQADCIDDALKLYEEIEKEWIETAKECGIAVPKQAIMSAVEYSGNISLRIGRDLHRRVAVQAEKENESINSFIKFALTEKVIKCECVLRDEPQASTQIKVQNDSVSIKQYKFSKKKRNDESWIMRKALQGI
ncbi:MAG: toxin-antitoxin system HicB family antitoxin, partial [Christensenellaceae bacterium]